MINMGINIKDKIKATLESFKKKDDSEDADKKKGYNKDAYERTKIKKKRHEYYIRWKAKQKGLTNKKIEKPTEKRKYVKNLFVEEEITKVVEKITDRVNRTDIHRSHLIRGIKIMMKLDEDKNYNMSYLDKKTFADMLKEIE